MITVSISIVGIDSANSKNNKLQLKFLQSIKIQKFCPQKNKLLLGLLLICENMLMKNMLINYIKDLAFLAFYGLIQCNIIPLTVTNLGSNYLFNQSEDFKL